MSAFLHQWLTATQYIAPLMANFDTRLGNGSQIHFAKNGKYTFSNPSRLHRDKRINRTFGGIC